MTMNGNSETDVVKFMWEIDCVVGAESWVHSKQFYLRGKDRVGFDIGLRNTLPTRGSLQLRVRKNDLRPAKASIQINQIYTPQIFDNPVRNVDNPPQKVGWSKLHSIFFGNSSISSSSRLNSAKPSVTRSRIGALQEDKWKQFLTFDITGYKNEAAEERYDDCKIYLKMKIECEITWMGFINEEPESITPTGFEQFLKADVFSDITLIVDNQELPAHKVILSTHSPYFHEILTSGTKEAKESRIPLEDFSLDVVTEMLEFFYTGKTRASDNIDVALKMIEVAEMYKISRLKEICETTLINNMNIYNVLDISNVADD
ncbi:uncharacterized protein LOC130665769 isoform X1 [Microplitis mediator]|uniref:uncharacterized protein LOC130665769 isoform X1 n=1 Tax=Microplitis mediator TaxID=375433 RepID=UPI0025579131|nr:uncharacterized protein LOC130665769 isoform X1 [Microplitis mediator]